VNNYGNVDDAYLGALKQVRDEPDYECAPRGQSVKEIQYYQTTVLYPESRAIVTADKERNKVIESYTEKEMEWYLSGDRSVESAMKISKFWGKLANPDGTINSNYGHLLFKDTSEGNGGTPYEWALNALKKDKDTRQAVMRFNKPKHCYDGNKDFVCTMYANAHIRLDKLNFVVRMRSSDLHFGVVFDWPFFIRVQEMLIADLKDPYPELTIGSFTFSTDSLHIYERSFDVVNKMIGD
jgi:thymidylate synthase